MESSFGHFYLVLYKQWDARVDTHEVCEFSHDATAFQ